ncbi:MAG TPA: hypothetical protein VFU10_00140 [Gaiellaceae bacterium]|nr:hypothetical protein [Gaiellaceae bacterium]
MTLALQIAVTVVAAWLMVVGGISKNVVQLRAPAHCAACGRRLERGRCRCTGDGDGR